MFSLDDLSILWTPSIFDKNYTTAAVISHNLEGVGVPRSPSSVLGRQKSDVWLRDANIETSGEREGGKNVSRNRKLQPNGCEN